MAPLFRSDGTIILASGSPRRRELLSSFGIPFTVTVSGCPEDALPLEEPDSMVKRLALLKAHEVAKSNPAAWVIGADTDVVLDRKVIGKPEHAADAVRILKLMQGRTHLVWGGIAVVNRAKQVEVSEVHLSKVEMLSLSDELIQAYVATGEPLDKAGAYAAQGIGASFIKSIEGSYTNVVGLNTAALCAILIRLGVLRVYE